MVTGRLILRAARTDEAGCLSELAMRSKGYWGYSPEFLEACREELSVSAADIERPGWTCFVAETGDRVVGFHALQQLSQDEVELEALFVDPRHVRQGIGRRLMEHAVAQARASGALRMLIQGDPNAGPFYLASGAEYVGEKESASIPGRMLPLYCYHLASTAGP